MTTSRTIAMATPANRAGVPDPLLATMDTTKSAPRRLGMLVWLAGMLGVMVITGMVLPVPLGEEVLPAPLWLISLASLAQSALLVGLAAWAGVSLAPKVGLRAPAFEAAATGRPVSAAIRPQIAPGLAAGVLGGAALFAISGYAAPAALAEVQQRFELPILARVLYGGITEEVLLRWGLMTALVWVAWRLGQGRQGPPRALYVWSAIVASAVLFGAGHLPAAAMLIGELTTSVVLFVIGVNTGFGVLFGWLYWRYGLEAAMIAHATVRMVSYGAGLI